MNTRSTKAIYCWDTDVTLAWFKAEQDKPLADMESVVNDIAGNKATLLLSVITYAEILDTARSGNAAQLFRAFCKRSSVFLAGVNLRIAEKAAEIRERGEKVGRKIKTPDAFIMATAIVHAATVLHSFDMVNLNGSPIVENLWICGPVKLQGPTPNA